MDLEGAQMPVAKEASRVLDPRGDCNWFHACPAAPPPGGKQQHLPGCCLSKSQDFGVKKSVFPSQ